METKSKLPPQPKKRDIQFDFSVGRHGDLVAIEDLIHDAIRKPDFVSAFVERPTRNLTGGGIRLTDTLTLVLKFEKR